MSDEHRTEDFMINGEMLVARVKELLREGNVRRLSIKTEEGRTLIEIPLSAGVVGAAAMTLLAPVWAAIGALAAIATKLTLVVERVELGSEPPTDESAPQG